MILITVHPSNAPAAPWCPSTPVDHTSPPPGPHEALDPRAGVLGVRGFPLKEKNRANGI